MKYKAYVVFEGYKPGVYNTWAECNRQVTGYKDNLYQGFKEYSEAVEAYEKHLCNKKRAKEQELPEAIEQALKYEQKKKASLVISWKDYTIAVLVFIVLVQLVVITNY